MDEQILHRAAMLVSLLGEVEAAMVLIEDGQTKEGAFLLVQAGKLLIKYSGDIPTGP